MEILVLLLLLQIKHWYADFMIQTYEQTVKKGIYFNIVGIGHSIDHVCATLVALLLFHIFVPLSYITIILISLLEGAIHYHIDWVKVRYGSKDMFKPAFWCQFGMDQLAHQITYIAMVWYLLVK